MNAAVIGFGLIGLWLLCVWIYELTEVGFRKSFRSLWEKFF